MDLGTQLRTLTVNSLVETNLGMPAIYLIYLTLSARRTEDLSRRTQTLRERLVENGRPSTAR